MTFAARNLSVLSYANGFTLWHYTSADDQAAATGTGYFNPAADMLRKGDVIIANLNTGSTIQNAIYFVASSANGAVAVTGFAGA